jgi:hypothetical protein
MGEPESHFRLVARPSTPPPPPEQEAHKLLRLENDLERAEGYIAWQVARNEALVAAVTQFVEAMTAAVAVLAYEIHGDDG